jgi:DNA-binding NarL/FixJ family response regulator
MDWHACPVVGSSPGGHSGVTQMPGSRRSPTHRTRRARVLVVDDQAPFLAVLHELVSATLGLEVIAEARSGEKAIEAVSDTEPDVIVMDVWMPGIGGCAAAREIKAGWPSILVVLVSTSHPDEIALDPDAAFADALVWKSELDPRRLDDMWATCQDKRSGSAGL